MEDKVSKILFVINSLGTAGAEKALIELLNRLKGEPVEIDLYVLLNQGELIDEIPDYVNVLNKNYDKTEIHGEIGKRHLIRYALKSLFKHGSLFVNLGQLVYEGIGMLVHGRFHQSNLLWQAMATGADRFAKEYDLAVAYTEGGSAYYVSKYVKAAKKASFMHIAYSDAGYTRSLDRDCYLKMDRIFPVSNEVRDEFLKAYPELKDKAVVFNNLINSDKILSMADTDTHHFSGEGTKILTVGRLTKQKALEKSIRAAAILKSKGCKFTWNVLGEGDERDFLTGEIARNGVSDCFFLLGNLANPYPEYKAADIYVHASRFEGKAIAIQEAQIFSRPIIATDCNGNREQIDNGTDGILCEFSPESIADSIVRLMDDSNLAASMGAKAETKIMNIINNNNGISLILEML